MKLNTLSFAALSAVFLLASCATESKKDGEVTEPVAETEVEVVSEEAVSYEIDNESSTVSWSGKKVYSDEGHNGTIGIQSGSVSVINGELVGGELVIDMNTISVSDIGEEEGSAKLIAHLAGTAEGQANDFFNVTEFPTAKYVITAVMADTIIGDLTVRGTTLPYKFPATVTVDEEETSVSGTLVFDRSKFGVDFGTEKAMGPWDKLVGKAKGYAIQNEITIDLDIVAKK